MMTPTAQIEFYYEKQFSDGTTERGINFTTANGWWEAHILIEKHGVNPPSQTTILNGKEYTYAINKLPYERGKGEREVIAYFNNPKAYRNGIYPYELPIVNVHLVFQRVNKKNNHYAEYR